MFHAEHFFILATWLSRASNLRETSNFAVKREGREFTEDYSLDAVVRRLLETKPLKFDKVKVDKKRPGRLLG